MSRETYWGAQILVAAALVVSILLQAPDYVWLGILAAETLVMMFRLRDSRRPGWLALAFPLIIIFPGPLAGMLGVQVGDPAGAEGMALLFVIVGGVLGLISGLAMIATIGTLKSRANPSPF